MIVARRTTESIADEFLARNYFGKHDRKGIGGMGTGIAICLAFAAGWFISGWQTQRYWSKWVVQSLEFADHWRISFYQVLAKLPESSPDKEKG